MPPRRGFSAGLLSEAAEKSVTRARESLKDEPGDLLTKLLELSCGHFFTLTHVFFPVHSLVYVIWGYVDVAGISASSRTA